MWIEVSLLSKSSTFKKGGAKKNKVGVKDGY